MIPPSDGDPEELLDALDGIVFSGGADIDPQRYGARREPETTGIRPDRDRSEMELMERCLQRGVPLLAICRGMQLLNVVRGGTLRQHLEGSAHRTAPGVFSRHDVEIADGSRLCAILGPRSMVPSHHHQAPDRLGSGLVPVAAAPDGTMEAIEDPQAKMVLGVLWHPEETEDRALFEELVSKAREYRKERS